MTEARAIAEAAAEGVKRSPREKGTDRLAQAIADDLILWGQHDAHGPYTMKIMGGTAAECRKAREQRVKEGWKNLQIIRPGVSPDRVATEPAPSVCWTACTARFNGQPIGFHITDSKHGSVSPVCESAANIADHRTPAQIEQLAKQLAAVPELILFLSAYIELAEHHGDDDTMPGLPDCLSMAKALRVRIGGAA